MRVGLVMVMTMCKSSSTSQNHQECSWLISTLSRLCNWEVWDILIMRPPSVSSIAMALSTQQPEEQTLAGQAPLGIIAFVRGWEPRWSVSTTCQILKPHLLFFFLGDLKLSCSPTWHLEFRCNLTWAFACLWGTDLAINKNKKENNTK